MDLTVSTVIYVKLSILYLHMEPILMMANIREASLPAKHKITHLVTI